MITKPLTPNQARCIYQMYISIYGERVRAEDLHRPEWQDAWKALQELAILPDEPTPTKENNK